MDECVCVINNKKKEGGRGRGDQQGYCFLQRVMSHPGRDNTPKVKLETPICISFSIQSANILFLLHS